MTQKITDYPMTFPFGATSAPYSASHPHKGQDYGLTKQPVLVGDTIIGVSGNTGSYLGQTYAYHLHVQAGTDSWAQSVVDPTNYVGQPGTVVKTGWANEWGNYACVLVNGIYVYYCHLSQINVTVGTVLHAEDNVAIIQNSDNWKARLNKVMQHERGRSIGDDEFKNFVGQDFLHYVEAVQDNPEADTWFNMGQVGRQAVTDNWQQQITDRNQWINDRDTTIGQLQSIVSDLTSKYTADQLTIQSLQPKPAETVTEEAAVAPADTSAPTKSSLLVKLLASVLAIRKKKS